MATKAERRAARERVSAYHDSQLAGLLGHVGAEIDRYRAGEIDAYVDYSGTLWANILKRTDNPGRQAVLAQLTVLKPSSTALVTATLTTRSLKLKVGRQTASFLI